MIKKLRRKFICMNMTIITVILVTILCAIVHLTTQNLERSSIQTLHELASDPIGEMRPGRQPEVHPPYLLLRLGTDGAVVGTEDSHFPISDPDILEELIQTALDTPWQSGLWNRHGRSRNSLLPMPPTS